ncbi:hypothetical protein [Streptomyces sp. NPDC001930]|uniref:hypothetical protein n=1 Tax=Streptomyces sp. NPDC001930 TaxID=3364625 RepID=UPI003690B60B
MIAYLVAVGREKREKGRAMRYGRTHRGYGEPAAGGNAHAEAWMTAVSRGGVALRCSRKHERFGESLGGANRAVKESDDIRRGFDRP